jgi:hypothetical protein
MPHYFAHLITGLDRESRQDLSHAAQAHAIGDDCCRFILDACVGGENGDSSCHLLGSISNVRTEITCGLESELSRCKAAIEGASGANRATLRGRTLDSTLVPLSIRLVIHCDVCRLGRSTTCKKLGFSHPSHSIRIPKRNQCADERKGVPIWTSMLTTYLLLVRSTDYSCRTTQARRLGVRTE